MFTGNAATAIMVMVFEVTGLLPLKQDELEVIWQVTASSPFDGVVVKVGLFVPAEMPFTFHWYTGARPPFVGIAVKVADEPVQIGLTGVEMATLAGRVAFTTIVIALEVTGLPLTQAALEVSTQVTICPLAGVKV